MKATRLAAIGVSIALATAAQSARADSAGFQQSYIPGRVGVRGTVPNPGTQQQELANITFPAPYNVFEFTVTCGACHAGTVDQQVAHFGVQSGTAMASSARDPVFRANQIATNNILRAVTGEDGAGNMCFRCHSPNGWYSGRFDPTLGGDAEGKTMIHSILLSTDDEGISCEMCHRAIGAVQYKKPGLDPNAAAWNLMAGIGGYSTDPGWPHDGKAFVDQAGTPTAHPGAPFGDTSLQYNEGMTYSGPYSGTVQPYFSDVPNPAWGATDYTGQIYAVYPPGDPREGQPVVNVDGSIAPAYDLPVSAPIDWARSDFTVMPPRIVYDYQAQAMSLEHPTAQSTFMMTSEFCGSCHDLTVPVLNHGMPEQRTYTEWKFSAFSQANASTTLGIPVATERTQAGEVRCQDCHMPKMRHEYADNAPAASNADPLITGWFPYAKDRNPTGGTSKHTHAGANRDLGAMMKFLYPEPDLELIGVATGADVRIFPGMLSTRNPMYDRNIRNNEISMADAVSVAVVSGPTATATPGVYEVQVQVTNRTGHRIPTGYPDGRRMWVSLDVKDATGASVYRSGVYDAAASRLYNDASAPVFTRAQTNVISSGPQPVGNAVQARGVPSDGATNVLVVSPAVLGAGTLTSFETFVQAGSEGRTFEAYVLRPTGVAGEFSVVFASGALTVPATPGVVASYPVAGVAVQAGDRIAHRGNGVPFDFSATGVDAVHYPISATPAQGATVLLGGAGYPTFDPAAYGQQPRTYSFGATVVGGNAVMVYERVTCRDGLVPGAPLNDGAADGICEDPGTPMLVNNRIMFDNRIPPAGFTYADYRTGGIKFWNYTMAPNPNAGGALRPVPCEDAPGYTATAGAFGGSCPTATAQRYPDGQGHDVVTYRFASATPPVSARAEINWQTHTREFMELLRDQQESLGLVDNVRPTGPINAMQVGYPLAPSYLSDVVGLASIADPYQPGVPLRDNWGGIAYAAWLSTGKGAPAIVAAADTSVTAPPAAPATLAVTATQGLPFEANVTWSEVPGAEGYLVYILYGCPTRAQKTDGTIEQTRCYDPIADVDAAGVPLPEVSTVGTSTKWDRLAIVKPDACAAGTCTLVNTAMNVNKTYGFKVAAFNAAGLGAETPVFTYRSPWDIPLAPDLLKLVAVTSTTATLTWTDKADNENIFVVQLVPVGAPQPPLSATLTPTPDGMSVVVPPAPEVVYVFATQTPGGMGFGGNNQTIGSLLSNTAYNVQVQACNQTACSGMNTNGPIQFRTAAVLTPPALDPLVLAPSPMSVTLTWSASAGAADYLVERSANGVTWEPLPALAVTTLTDTNVAANTTYSYRVYARNGADVSQPSNVQSITTPASLATPGTPTATGPTSTRRVTVAWTYTNQGQTGFQIHRTKVGGTTVLVATATAAARSYLDTLPAVAATQGTADRYTYTVTALQGTVTSLPSAPSNTVTLLPALPGAPRNLTVANAGAGALRLRFEDNARNETGFAIERQRRQRSNLASCSGTWSAYTASTLPAQPPAAGLGAWVEVVDGGLNSGACYQYRYRVRAFNDRGNSAWTTLTTPRSAP